MVVGNPDMKDGDGLQATRSVKSGFRTLCQLEEVDSYVENTFEITIEPFLE